MKAAIVNPTVFLVAVLIIAPMVIHAVQKDNENMLKLSIERETLATQAGDDAFRVGLSANENPYDKGSELHALWLSGYRKAMEAKK